MRRFTGRTAAGSHVDAPGAAITGESLPARDGGASRAEHALLGDEEFLRSHAARRALASS